MAYEIIPNAILFAAIAGVLGMFFRHVPEAVEAGIKEDKKTRILGEAEDESSALVAASSKTVWYKRDYTALASRAARVTWRPMKQAGSIVGKKAWQFMLEAKDLKQGQILASKFARMVTPTTLRYTSTAVHTPMADAEVLATAGNFDEAEQKYFEVLKKFPHEYTAYEGLVKIYLQQKQYDNLAETLEYLVRHVPENDSYWAQYGNVLMSTRQYDKAIPAFEKAIGLNALIPARFANLALSQQAIGNVEDANANFQKASELEPSNIQYLGMYVDALVQLGERQQAIELLQNAKVMLPASEQDLDKHLERIQNSL